MFNRLHILSQDLCNIISQGFFFKVTTSVDGSGSSPLTVLSPRKSLCPRARAGACGHGFVELGGSRAEEMGCVRRDRWQSHLFTVSSLAWGQGEGRTERGRVKEGLAAGGGGSCMQGSLGNRKKPKFMIERIYPRPLYQPQNMDAPFCLNMLQPDCVGENVLA